MDSIITKFGEMTMSGAINPTRGEANTNDRVQVDIELDTQASGTSVQATQGTDYGYQANGIDVNDFAAATQAVAQDLTENDGFEANNTLTYHRGTSNGVGLTATERAVLNFNGFSENPDNYEEITASSSSSSPPKSRLNVRSFPDSRRVLRTTVNDVNDDDEEIEVQVQQQPPSDTSDNDALPNSMDASEGDDDFDDEDDEYDDYEDIDEELAKQLYASPFGIGPYGPILSNTPITNEFGAGVKAQTTPAADQPHTPENQPIMMPLGSGSTVGSANTMVFSVNTAATTPLSDEEIARQVWGYEMPPPNFVAQAPEILAGPVPEIPDAAFKYPFDDDSPMTQQVRRALELIGLAEHDIDILDAPAPFTRGSDEARHARLALHEAREYLINTLQTLARNLHIEENLHANARMQFDYYWNLSRQLHYNLECAVRANGQTEAIVRENEHLRMLNERFRVQLRELYEERQTTQLQMAALEAEITALWMATHQQNQQQEVNENVSDMHSGTTTTDATEAEGQDDGAFHDQVYLVDQLQAMNVAHDQFQNASQ